MRRLHADFDGDQMAVHIPLSIEAQTEARALMLSTNNILSPAHGKPLTIPSQDMVLGCYYLTKVRGGAKGEGRIFANFSEVRIAYDQGVVALQARIKVRLKGELVDTTVGRVLFYESVPKELAFSSVNRQMDKRAMSELVVNVTSGCARMAPLNFWKTSSKSVFSMRHNRACPSPSKTCGCHN
jgi:DNA-directed RNA polymerase subunit beta'